MSSSAHLTLLPRLLGWGYRDLDPGERKAFEVALHLGSAPGLALAARASPPASVGLLGLTLLPPAVIGFVLEGPIERRLGGPRTVALAQLAGGTALWLADRRHGRREAPNARDHLAVGVGQALALAPGVSRAGAALTAGRLRGLSRPAAAALALNAAIPVTIGAAALKGFRLARARPTAEARRAMIAGAGASLATGLVAHRVFRRVAAEGSYTPLAAYRIGFGAVALAGTAWRSRSGSR